MLISYLHITKFIIFCSNTVVTDIIRRTLSHSEGGGIFPHFLQKPNDNINNIKPWIRKLPFFWIGYVLNSSKFRLYEWNIVILFVMGAIFLSGTDLE